MSSEHWNVEPVSVEWKLKLALPVFVDAAGPESISVSGGVESTVQLNEAGVGSVLPAASVAFTWKLCDPSATVYAFGEVQEAKAALSNEHWNVDPASVEWKLKLALPELVEAAGLESITVSGAVESTVHE